MKMRSILSGIIFLIFMLNIKAQEKFTDPRDSAVYRILTIAGITWMAENLKYTVPGSEPYYFDNNPHNKGSYGMLYDWKSATLSCPDGWHLPSGEEFRTLISNLETDESWQKSGSGPGSFRIQLAGMQDHEGIFSEIDESGYYWTSTEYNAKEAEFFSFLVLGGQQVIDISREADMPDIHGAEKTSKYSVRCVKD